MRLKSRPCQRGGATLVEAAIVIPLALFVVFGLVVGGMGVFRYQEVAHLSREAARFAAVHGGQYAQENAQAIQQGTLPNVNDAYLTNSIVLPKCAAMDLKQVQVQVSLNTPSGTFDWDNTSANNNRAPTATVTQNKQSVTVTNTVSVTVTYRWTPELYLIGPISLTSTSVMPMSY